jgi:sugar phosphate isomerase/epimerase
MQKQSTELVFPELKGSFKGRFPFRLSVPSYIYPAGYAENAKRLGPFVDEIELLLFESSPESLPPPAEVRELYSLSRQFNFSYNVHLPLDTAVGGIFPKSSSTSLVRRLTEAIERIRPLSPEVYILHLALNNPNPCPSMLQEWQEQVADCIGAILQTASLAPRQIAIETLSFPPEWFAPVVNRMDLAVCVDVGHILLYGMNLEDILQLFAGRIEMIHLHGIADGQDHQSLVHLPPHARTLLQTWLQEYRGTVSIEVFNFERLQKSLDTFARMIDVAKRSYPF